MNLPSAQNTPVNAGEEIRLTQLSHGGG